MSKIGLSDAAFKKGEFRVLIVSKVANFSIDLYEIVDAEKLVQNMPERV